MAEQLLTKTELLAYNKQISSNIEEARVNQAILDAQRLDFEPLVGRAFYYELWNAISSSPVASKYTVLRDGTNYTDTNGYTVQLYGYKPVIAYYAIARLRAEQDAFITRSGNKFKERDQSERISYKAVDAITASDRGKAVYYQENLLAYLEQNKSSYPNWNNYTPKTVRGSGFQIHGLDKSANGGSQNY